LLTAGGDSVTHDVNGNMTLIPAALRPSTSSLALAWDMDNRMSTADVGNDSSVDVTYKFDALGRRVYRDDSTDQTVYFQVGQQTLADYAAGANASSPLYNYVWASYIDEPVMREEPSTSDLVYYHRNQQYSIVAITDDTGTILERYAYSAYGVPTITTASGTVILPSSAEDNRYMYTGREWDEALDLYHYRARMYDPISGRFCSKDLAEYQDGANLFNYYAVLVDTDPSGMLVTTPDDEARTVPRKIQCSLNCCCCPRDIVFEPGTKILKPNSAGFFTALAPFKSHLKMVFQPVDKAYSDPAKATSDCGFEWWEYRIGSAHPETGNADKWDDVLKFPKITHWEMFDEWFKKSRPQECFDKRGKPAPMPFTVVIPDRPGVDNGPKRTKVDGFIGIVLRANPNCKCKQASVKLMLRIRAGKLYATLDKISDSNPLPSPPGAPPGW
jgi:RHS repeat-associated protein